MSSVAVSPQLLPEKTDFELLPLEMVACAPARRGIATWQTLRGARRFPARSALKPRDLAAFMQYMSVVQVIDNGGDFENRFVGDAVVRAHEVPIERRRFSDVAADMPTLMGQLLPLFRHVVKTGEPLAYRGKTGHDMQRVAYTDFEGVLLPLGETDEAVDHVVYVGVCTVKVAPGSPTWAV